MVKIAPSILAADFTKLGEEIESVIQAGADLIHVDVMDGKFVNNTTSGVLMYRTAMSTSNIPVDTHLMVENPLEWIRKNVIATDICELIYDEEKSGMQGENSLYLFKTEQLPTITFHIEAVSVEEVDEIITILHQNKIHVGIAIKPSTPIDTLFPYLDKIDMVLVMTVEPGFGGQDLILGCLEKVQALRSIYPKIDIEVDGGINIKTANIAKKAGANILVAGTAIFKEENRKKVIDALRGQKEG